MDKNQESCASLGSYIRKRVSHVPGRPPIPIQVSRYFSAKDMSLSRWSTSCYREASRKIGMNYSSTGYRFSLIGSILSGEDMYADPAQDVITACKKRSRWLQPTLDHDLPVRCEDSALTFLTRLGLKSRFGDKPGKSQVLCPRNGTAVLKRLMYLLFACESQPVFFAARSHITSSCPTPMLAYCCTAKPTLACWCTTTAVCPVLLRMYLVVYCYASDILLYYYGGT